LVFLVSFNHISAASNAAGRTANGCINSTPRKSLIAVSRALIVFQSRKKKRPQRFREIRSEMTAIDVECYRASPVHAFIQRAQNLGGIEHCGIH
jgi:hypothetical protein